MKAVLFRGEDTYIQKFISFPDLLYTKGQRTQNKRTEKALLQGAHCLNKDAEVWGALVLAVNGDPLARCMISYYEGGEEAFLGFFECTENPEACHRLMEAVKNHARQRGRMRVTGPVDVAFWLSYGLKTDHFETPYMGEPYHLAYYAALLAAEGFQVAETLVSTRYHIPETAGSSAPTGGFEMTGSSVAAGGIEAENSEVMGGSGTANTSADAGKQASRENVPESGSERIRTGKYEARGLKKRELHKILEDLYRLGKADCEAFCGGCVGSEKSFARHLTHGRRLFDFAAVQVAYREEEPVGFLAAVPDYGRLVSGSSGWLKGLRIRLIRRKPKRYLLWYLGAEQANPEVYETLSAALRPALLKRSCDVIRVPLAQGKLPEGCLAEYKVEDRTYTLLSAPL